MDTLGGSFQIDITNLKAGLAQANRLIRESESQFKAAAAGMDDWSDSQEGLTAKIKSLQNVIDLQDKKVSALQASYDDLISGGLDPMSAEAVKLRTQINNETAALEKNKRELDQQKDALQDVASGNKKASVAIEAASKAAEKAEGGFTVLKGAMANLVADGFRMAISSAKEFATSMIEVAAEVKASNSQFEQAFGDLEEQAAESIKGIADSTGILDTRLKNTGAGIYSFARSSGANTTEAMDLMQEALMATADSAAYYDRSLEDSAETLQSFLKGNFANDAALGISATEFTRNAKATELFGKKYNDLSEIEKQKTLLKMVTDGQKLSGAFGQAARESDGFENVMGNVNETMKQFKAKVGTPVLESLIPVIQDATGEFQDFADSVDWDAFGKKVTKKLQDIIKTGKELGKEALPTVKRGFEIVGDATKFVTNNFETLAKVTGTAVVTYKSFSAIMATTTAISSAKTAIAGLSAGVDAATKAQTVWNAAMSANPIGAVITAVGLLAGGIALLVKKQKESAEADIEAIMNKDLLTESQRAAVTAAQESAQSYKENRDAAFEMANAEIANIDYTQRLWNELQTLADKNGNVKAGYEGRAQYILGELNSALGTEYTMNDGIIQQYGEMNDSINTLIETKKAEAMLSAYEENYKQAVQNVADAEKARATQAQELSLQRQALAQSDAEVAAATAEYEKKSNEAKTEAQFIALAQDTAHLNELKANRDAEKAKLDELQGKYNETSGALENYYSDISTYEDASAEMLSGNTQKAIDILNKRGEGFKTAASTVKLGADEQKKVLSQQVVDTEVNARLMEEAYKNGTEGVSKEMVETARSQAEAAKAEFASVGGNITQGIADGAGNNSYVLNNAMTRIINDAVNAAKKAADSHSPSRRFKKEVGVTIPQGIAVGITSGTKNVVNSVKKMVNTSITAAKTSFAKSGYEKVNTDILNKSTKSIDSYVTSSTNSVKSLVNKSIETYSKSIDKKIKTIQANVNKNVAAIKADSKLSAAEKTSRTNKIKEAGKAEVEALKNNKDAYKKAGAASIKAYTDSLKSFSTSAKATIKAVMDDVNKTFTDHYNDLVNKQQSLQKSFVDIGSLYRISDDGSLVINNLKTQTDAITKYASNLKKIKGKVSGELFDEIASMSIEDGQTYVEQLLKMSNKEIKAYNTSYTNKLSAAKKLSQQIYNTDLDALKKDYTKAVNNALSGVTKKITNLGSQTITGFISGMKSQNSAMTSEVKKIANSIVNEFKKKLKIKSPSRLMRDEIGKQIPAGVAYGIADGTGNIVKSVKTQVRDIQKAYDFDDITGSVNAGFTARENAVATPAESKTTGGVTVYQTNNYSQAHSRYELYKSKQQTAAAVRLAMVGV